jgi:hypothetical protein
MKKTTFFTNYSTVLMLVAALCLAFFAIGFTPANAQENTEETETETTKTKTETETETETEDEDEDGDGDGDGEEGEGASGKRAAMMEQIKSLREMIKERNKANKVEVRENMAEQRAEFKTDRAEFMASIAELEGEEKRAAMMEFITELRAEIAARKASFTEQKEAIKTERVEMRDEFKTSIEGMGRADKIAAIMEQVEELKKRIAEKLQAENEAAEDTDEPNVDDETEEEEEETDETEEDEGEETEEEAG